MEKDGPNLMAGAGLTILLQPTWSTKRPEGKLAGQTLKAMLLLQKTQTIRDSSGFVLFTTIHLASSDYAKITQEARVQYAETAKGLGGKHTMGQPHAHKVQAAVEATIILKTIIDNAALYKQIVGYHSDSLAASDQVAASVTFFIKKPIFKRKDKTSIEVRIQLALTNHKLKTEKFDEGEDIDYIFVKFSWRLA